VTLFKRKGEKTKYSFVDSRCIGRYCWAPGMYRHMSIQSMGLRNTGSPDSPCCMNRAYHGCPEGPEGATETNCDHRGYDGADNCLICRGKSRIAVCGLPTYNQNMAQQRKTQGWRTA
jgi:hypothetical protein